MTSRKPQIDDITRKRLIERALADLANTTNEEDARLTAAAAADPDNPPLPEHRTRRPSERLRS
jgi:hypothetical protein